MGRTLVSILGGFLLSLTAMSAVAQPESWPELPTELALSDPLGSLPAAFMAASHARFSGDEGNAARFYAQDFGGVRAEAASPYDALTTYMWVGHISDARRISDQLFDQGGQDDLINLGRLVGRLAAAEFDELRFVANDIDPETYMGQFREPMQALGHLGAGEDGRAFAILRDRIGIPSLVTSKDLLRAFVMEQRGDLGAAEAAYRNLTGSPFRNGHALKLAAEFFWRRGEFDLARSLYAQASQVGTFIQSDLGIALRQNDLDAAPQAPQNIAEMAAALFALQATYLIEEEGEGAELFRVSFWQSARTLAPNDPTHRLTLTLSFADGQHWVSLIRLNAGAPISPATYPAMTQILADAHMSLELYSQAAELAGDALTLFPDGGRLALIKGNAHFRLNELPQALEAYETAARLLDMNPNLAWLPLFRLGVVHSDLGNWDLAETAFLASLEKDPNRATTLNYLGYTWADQNRNVEEALDMIRRAVEQVPTSSAYVDSLGWAYYRLGRYPEALATLQEAVDLAVSSDPDGRSGLWELHDHLGDAYAALNQDRDAVFRWRQALSYLPMREDLSEKRQSIEAKINAAR